MEIVYRTLETIEELEKVVDLEIAVWGLPARDATPSGLLHAMVGNGSLVVGAFDDNRLVGMAFMFPSSRHKHKLMWSHMAAVQPSYQRQGIGFGLKHFQRNWALDKGYQSIGWTFDPLQRGNANFNLHVLGGTSSIYHVDFYGELTDGLNAGLPSDRLEIVWSLRSPRVKSLSRKLPPRATAPANDISDANLLVYSDQNKPRVVPQILTDNFYLIEIPQNINHLKQESKTLALEWRFILRETFLKAFRAGYIVQDFVTILDHPYYVLAKTEAWYLYVLECADQTLYTGITPNVPNRIKMHSNGRGATYTKTRRPIRLLAAWQFNNRREAMQAEIAFKELSRKRKLDHINHKDKFRDADFVYIDL